MASVSLIIKKHLLSSLCHGLQWIAQELLQHWLQVNCECVVAAVWTTVLPRNTFLLHQLTLLKQHRVHTGCQAAITRVTHSPRAAESGQYVGGSAYFSHVPI